MSDEFRFVLIGTGNIAKTYVTAAGKIDGVKIVGAVSRSGKKPAGLEKDENFEVAATLKEIKTPFDGVIITTPNGLHHVGAIEAAELGKHVLTEKPLDITVEAMDKMIKCCRENCVKLGVAFQSRTRPDIQAVKKLIEENKLGRIFAADLSVKFYRDQAYYDSASYRGGYEIDGGGPFIQQASHNIDIYTWLFGLPEKVVSMLDTFMHKIEGEDHGAALLRYPNGMIGTIIASTSTYPGFSPKLEIHSEAGTIVLESANIKVWEVKDIENPALEVKGKKHTGAGSATVSDTSGHEAIISDFVQSVKEDREPLVTGKSARLATELILQIYNSKIQ